jgi:negative regulator of flagellin synthesis FlgM
MAVNLNGLDLSGAPASSAPKTSTAQSATTGSQDATQESQSQVSITSTAALLARLQQALTAKPAIDWGAVDTIRRAIDAGSYKVNADKVAHGLIHSERTLGQLKLSEI